MAHPNSKGSTAQRAGGSGKPSR